MEDFFEILFPFLMVAIVVGSRLVLTLRRRNRDRQEKSPVPAAPPKAARGFVPWEDEFREAAPVEDPAETVAPDEDESFSAWDLSVNDDPPVPATLPVPASRPSLPETPPPASFTAVSARFGAAAERLTVVPDRLAAPQERIFPARISRPAPESPKLRFRGLSSLQQAVVWAEILGVPRGF
jgi:hypothetical protein